MRHRPPSELFLNLHKDSQICFLLALISHAKVKWEAVTFLVNFVVFTAYCDCETFIHSFIHSWMLFIFTFCKAFSWVYVLMHRNGHEANAFHSPLCWSDCQVLVTMVPVWLSGAGRSIDCLMLLLFRIWSKEISLYWKWAVDLEKWRPSIWWPLCRECHCDPTGNGYDSLRYYVENCLPCSVNTL